MSPTDIVLCSALRSPIGSFLGTLSAIRPDDLLARLFEAVISNAAVDPSQIDEVFAGCANQAGEDNRNIARMSTLLAGIPQHVPAVIVN
jgi:acetyl-CoA C-acetyltransferase